MEIISQGEHLIIKALKHERQKPLSIVSFFVVVGCYSPEWTNTAIKPNMMSWTHLSQWRLDLDNIIVYYNEIMTGLDHYPTLSNYKTVRYMLVPHFSMSFNSILEIYAIHSGI